MKSLFAGVLLVGLCNVAYATNNVVCRSYNGTFKFLADVKFEELQRSEFSYEGVNVDGIPTRDEKFSGFFMVMRNGPSNVSLFFNWGGFPTVHISFDNILAREFLDIKAPIVGRFVFSETGTKSFRAGDSVICENLK